MIAPLLSLAPGGTSVFAFILLSLAVVLALALVGRWLVSRLGLPGVLGEIMVGIVLGNVGVALGIEAVEVVANMGHVTPILDTMFEENVSLSVASRQVLTLVRPESAEIAQHIVDLLNGPNGSRLLSLGQAARLFSDLGVVLLMFMTGLSVSLGRLAASGKAAVRVAILGALLPFALTAGASYAMRPDEVLLAHLFLGTLFVDTALGITARIFGDSGQEQSAEARIVLGAGVMDQVLTLILIAVITTLAASPEPSFGEVGSVVALALVFVGLLTMFGERTVRWMVPLFDALDFQTGRFLFSLSLVFSLSWLASVSGLEAVMGGFAAGLVLNESNLPSTTNKVSIRERAAPLEAFFSPIFFVLVGARVNVSAFLDPSALAFAGLLLVAGMGGKLLAGLGAGGAAKGRVVGVALMPRGGTMLIFAGIGRQFDLMSDEVFAALAIFIITSMLITGAALSRMLRGSSGDAATE
ncbi:MAG: hypothetical protein DRQ55_05700 [Planctomycetota bacterium]|nr:MAG: hypothetical protein DRQ55_05700 [Planctomycetota bacterium]